MDLKELKSAIERIDRTDLLKLEDIVKSNNEFLILGNGGSNAISCHIAEDYTKALSKKAICFGDSARMSCYANDYGWPSAYVKFIEHMKTNDTVVILISSSGNSDNILNCAEYCCNAGLRMITMSGFDSNNKLRKFYSDKSMIHFWIDSRDYGVVECAHEIILHSVI